MYWKHNNPTSPQIEAVLNKEDVTLRDLMDEEDILQECKSQNKKLIDFLVRPEVIEELVTLTTVEPSNELDEKARYKYSNIACELLTSDVPALNERLANDGALLGKLYYFLESDPPLNPLLASYFSKTLSKLVSQRTEQDWYSYQVICLQVLEFLKSKENFVLLLVKHLGTSAIMDLMLKLITNIEGVEIKQNILNWLDSEHIVQSLIALLNPSVDSDRQCNAAQLLSDIIVKSRDITVNGNERSNPDPIIATLESSETIKLLLDNILGPEKTETSIVGGIQVLLALLNFNKNNAAADINYEQREIAAEKEHREKVIQNVNTAIIGRLKDFHEILLTPPKKPPIKTTIGLLDPPFGNTRLQVTKLLAALLLCNSNEVKCELAKLGSVNVLLDLFFKYTWNNFLHTQVQNCIAYALVPVTKIEETNNDNIIYEHIIVQCRLLGRILEAWDDNEQKQSQPKGVRQGYMGHLINIANNISEQWDKTPLGEFIKAHVNKETVESWTNFVSGPLEEINKKHQVVLGGVHPSNSLADDNQDEYRNIPFPSDSEEVDLSYILRMHNSAQSASNPEYIGNFEYNEDEESQADAAEMFEQMARNFYNSVEEEDEMWENQGSTIITTSSPSQSSSSSSSVTTITTTTTTNSNIKSNPIYRRWKFYPADRRCLDDPIIANKLDAAIADPWKNDDSPVDPMIAPIQESDPWSNAAPESSSHTTANISNTIEEGWANFDSFSNFVNGMSADSESHLKTSTSNDFCATFTNTNSSNLSQFVEPLSFDDLKSTIVVENSNVANGSSIISSPAFDVTSLCSNNSEMPNIGNSINECQINTTLPIDITTTATTAMVDVAAAVTAISTLTTSTQLINSDNNANINEISSTINEMSDCKEITDNLRNYLSSETGENMSNEHNDSSSTGLHDLSTKLNELQVQSNVEPENPETTQSSSVLVENDPISTTEPV